MVINGSHSATRSYDGAVCKLSSSCDVCVISLRPQELSSAENRSKACRNNRQLGAEMQRGEGPERNTILTLEMILAFKIFPLSVYTPHIFYSRLTQPYERFAQALI